jgi:hypothetical protein
MIGQQRAETCACKCFAAIPFTVLFEVDTFVNLTWHDVQAFVGFMKSRHIEKCRLLDANYENVY